MKLKYEVDDRGSEHGQYFSGAGVCGTKYDSVVIGAGHSARDAGEDALEQFYQSVDRTLVRVGDAEALEKEIAALPDDDCHEECWRTYAKFSVPDKQAEKDHEMCEISHFVVIRWKLEDDPAHDPIFTK